jgi:hypothetical protein
MKRTIGLLLAVFVALTIMAQVAIAHHSFAMFDRTIEKVATGTVVRWTFNNPHSWLYMNVKDKDGKDVLWSFEASSPTSLLTKGVNGTTFEPGKTITVLYCPMKDGRPAGGLGWVRLADGKFLNPADGGCSGSDATIEKWKGWLAKGYTSSADAKAAEGTK